MKDLVLNLKNVGLIKEASIKINGLTVIAGENDTGKSTVGKSLFFINQGNVVRTLRLFNDIFYFQPQDIKITFNKNNANFKSMVFSLSEKRAFKTVFIETPIIVNLFHLFSQLDTVQSQMTSELLNNQDDIEYFIIELIKKYSFNYPYTSKDLYNKFILKLKNETSLDKDKFVDDLKDIIDGELIYVPLKGIVFKRGNQEFDINSVATGIKNFGILQLLIKNNYLTKDSILIVDEPEVHLHPKWQLEYAKFIVELVKNGVKVLITSHSPYMIDALKYYSDENNINNTFYLSEKNNKEESVITDVTEDLSPIFIKLTEPLERLHKMRLGFKNDD